MKTFISPFGKIELGALIASKGEGAVHEIVDRQDLAAKIYHREVTREKAQKIELMASLATEQLLALTAWPSALLKTPSGTPRGFLMPKVVAHRDIHLLYSPKSRQVEFNGVTWPFLIRTAANIARVFAVIHETGCVIGDVNDGSIGVSQQATVRLFDCDSFQILHGGKRFLCEVGVSTFTPPELQGQSFANIVRTQNHDNFGLAVLVFYLLFMGRHPFAGRFSGPGDMPIEKAISEFRFAYGANRVAVRMEPPPHTLPISGVSAPIATMLEKAFSKTAMSGGRPSGIEWAKALTALEEELKVCVVNASHHHVQGHSCPWCAIEGSTGAILFSIRLKHASGAALDIDGLWIDIQKVQGPGPAPEKPEWRNRKLPAPSSVAVAGSGPSVFLRGLSALIIIGIAIALCFAVPATAFICVTAGFYLAYLAYKPRPDKAVLETCTHKFVAAKQRLDHLVAIWERDVDDEPFRQRFAELSQAKTELKALPAQRQARFRELEQRRIIDQKKRFLDRHHLKNAKIPHIGSGKKAALASWGIQTASDISYNAVIAVPGFGATTTNRLVAWRKTVESQFCFDPKLGVDPRDIAAVDRAITATRLGLERQLQNGAQELTALRNRILTRRESLPQEFEATVGEFLQARADMKALGQ